MLKYIFIAIVLNISMVFSQTVQEQIDSLTTIIQNTDNDSLKADAYSELSRKYIGVDSVKSYNTANSAIKISKKNRDTYNLSKAYIARGISDIDYGSIDSAQIYLDKAHKILAPYIKADTTEKKMKLWLRSIYSLSVVASRQGDLEKKVLFKEKAIELAKELNDEQMLALSYTSIAVTFLNRQANKEAYGYLQKSGPLFKKNKHHANYIYNRIILANVLGELDSLDRMKGTLDSVKSYIDHYKIDSQLHEYYIALGEYFKYDNNYNEAIRNLNKALQVLENNKIEFNKSQLYNVIVNTHVKFGNYKEARRCAKIALEYTVSKKEKLTEAKFCKTLSDIEKYSKNYKKAFSYIEQYVEIKDSLGFEKLTAKLSQVETKYEKERKEREILELKNKNYNTELSLAKNKSQNYLLLLVSGTLFFVSVLGYLGYRNYKRKAKAKEKAIKTLENEQASKIQHAMLDGQESERKRIAADLHDGLAGRLSATRINLEKVSKNNNSSNKLNDAVKSIDDSLTELRGIARNLMPEAVLKYGLKAAVEDYCASISNNVDDLKFILQFYDTANHLSENEVLTIYRIIQELINNAVKHAKATEVLIQYMEEDGKIGITVEDNGIGFSKLITDTANKGNGLHNLKTRVAYLNGEIDFVTSPNEGTTVNILIPVKHKI